MSECVKCGKCCIIYAGKIHLTGGDCATVLYYLSHLVRKIGVSDDNVVDSLDEIYWLLGGIEVLTPIEFFDQGYHPEALSLDVTEYEEFDCICGNKVNKDDFDEDKEAYACPKCGNIITDIIDMHCAWFNPKTSLCRFHSIKPKECRDYPGKNHNFTCLNGIKFGRI